MMIKFFKIIVLIIFEINLIQSSVFASTKDDCKNSSFYIKNVKVDLTKKSIIEARSIAEKEAREIAFVRLLDRFTLKKKGLSPSLNTSQLVDFLKINNEANSDTRYVAKALSGSTLKYILGTTTVGKRGSGMTDTKFNSSTYNQRFVNTNDYRTQEFPAGSAVSISTKYLRLIQQ